MLWVRSSLPSCPQDFRCELNPPATGILSMITPCGITRNAHSWQGNTHNSLKNVTPQPLNLFSVFTSKSKSSDCSCEPGRQRNSNRNVQKSSKISRPALWQTETTKLFLVCECESKQQSQIQTADQSIQHHLVWGFIYLERCRAFKIHWLIFGLWWGEPFETFYTINYSD